MDNSQTKNYKKAPLSKIHLKIYLTLILGQIACGYSLGISGTALSKAQMVMHISDYWVGLIGAGSLIGLAGSALMGRIADRMGRIADRMGRRLMLMVDMYLLTLFTLLQLVTNQIGWIVVLRILIGLMIAIDYTVGNAWLVEWLPAKSSGRLQSQLIIYWTFGFIASYLTGILIPNLGAQTWRIVLASAAVPGLVAALYRSFFRLPPSPTWLASHGEEETAEKVVQSNLGENWGLSQKQINAQAPEKVTLKTLLGPAYRRQTIVGGLFYACQAFAFFGITIFLPILLREMHLGDSNLSGTIYNVCVLCGVLLGSWLFKKISRRAFLVGTFTLATIALLLLIIGTSWAPVVKITLFAGFAIVLSAGLVLDYPYPTELFDIKVRASGVGACITISRIGAAGGTFLLPVLTNLGGMTLAMTVCAVDLAIGGLVCFFWAPETSPRFQKK